VRGFLSGVFCSKLQAKEEQKMKRTRSEMDPGFWTGGISGVLSINPELGKVLSRSAGVFAF